MFFCRVPHFSRTLREVGYVSLGRSAYVFSPSPTEPAVSEAEGSNRLGRDLCKILVNTPFHLHSP